MSNEKLIHRLELLGRLNAVTEELDLIAKASEKGHLKKTVLTSELPEPLTKYLKRHLPGDWLVTKTYLEIVINGLIHGRMHWECSLAGRLLGYKSHFTNLDEIKKFCKSVGIGYLEVKKLGQHDLSVTLRSSASSKLIPKSKKPICYFESGLISGLLEQIGSGKVNLVESSCASVSGKVCKFILSRQSMTAGSGSLPLLPAEQYSEENLRLLTSLATHALNAIENTFHSEKARRQAVVDTLTGIYNHRYFQDTLRLEIKRADRHKHTLSMIMMDVNDFKQINDLHGHPKGDKILRELSEIFVQCVRDIDVVARYGGDEFTIILPQTDIKGCIIVARRIEKAVAAARLLRYRGHKVRVGVSMGLAELSDKTKTAPGIITQADKALRKAKKQKGRSIVYGQKKVKTAA